MLHQRRDVGKNKIRRCRTDHHHIDIGYIDAGIVDRDFCGLDTHVRCGLIRGAAMTSFNTGTGLDPLRRRIDHLLEIGIGQDFFRQVAACSRDSGIRHAASRCNRLPICCGT